MTSSIYKRVSDLEAFIPQLDAAQTENAQELLRMIGMLADSHNKLLVLLASAVGLESINNDRFKEKLYDLITDVNEMFQDSK